MRSLVLFLTLSLLPISALKAQGSESPSTNDQLNSGEARLVLRQLFEDERLRKKVADYEDWINKEKELYQREQAMNKREVEVEKRATAVAEGERDLAKQQAAFYKSLYDTVSKKRGCGFFGGIARVFTLGAHHCE